ncbi:anti-phage dCTP deaminase [Shewanella atlantica]|uniref:Cytidine deaminase n=1 Tax=Shewanella atlantica TaxID=271099 RepID=A0A3S0RFA3_9GAMM|nr:anti-phage dCTP deaminase [Shewanella atlantica]RTR27007.1 cytidine deaminase [Shewanella atlantica]
MTSNVAKKHSSPASSGRRSSSTSDSIKLISGRQSQELVIGLCGPIGAGIKTLRTALEKQLKILGYQVEHIYVSSLMNDIDTDKSPSITGSYDRYVKRQDQGDKLRHRFSHQILAEAIISKIATLKQQIKLNCEIEEDERFSGKVAYIVDQLKNPAEVELLRLVYQNNFYLIGVLRHESERKRNLRDEKISPKDIDDLIHRDRKSALKEGQHTEKTILDADFFIKNNQSHISELNKKVVRILHLIHGKNGLSPSLLEKGMYSAFSSSLQSACLSRQVGASILDIKGNIVATGRNDVPKSGGGLYTFEDDNSDYRCIHKGGKCYNDAHKNKIKEGISHEIAEGIMAILKEVAPKEEKLEQLVSEIFDNGASQHIADNIFKNTSVGSLIEYSRSIHAEMDAITSLARTGDSSTSGKILFTTTYPCHNCARHIVASGITQVYYIEPYEKSLALDLHDDAINDGDHTSSLKVNFTQFEGVSPRRYQKFFFATAERKSDTGEAEEYATKYNNHVDIQFIDSFQDFEDRITQDFIQKTKKVDLVEQS